MPDLEQHKEHERHEERDQGRSVDGDDVVPVRVGESIQRITEDQISHRIRTAPMC